MRLFASIVVLSLALNSCGYFKKDDNSSNDDKPGFSLNYESEGRPLLTRATHKNRLGIIVNETKYIYDERNDMSEQHFFSANSALDELKLDFIVTVKHDESHRTVETDEKTFDSNGKTNHASLTNYSYWPNGKIRSVEDFNYTSEDTLSSRTLRNYPDLEFESWPIFSRKETFDAAGTKISEETTDFNAENFWTEKQFFENGTLVTRHSFNHDSMEIHYYGKNSDVYTSKVSKSEAKAEREDDIEVDAENSIEPPAMEAKLKEYRYKLVDDHHGMVILSSWESAFSSRTEENCKKTNRQLLCKTTNRNLSTGKLTSTVASKKTIVDFSLRNRSGERAKNKDTLITESVTKELDDKERELMTRTVVREYNGNWRQTRTTKKSESEENGYYGESRVEYTYLGNGVDITSKKDFDIAGNVTRESTYEYK